MPIYIRRLIEESEADTAARIAARLEAISERGYDLEPALD